MIELNLYKSVKIIIRYEGGNTEEKWVMLEEAFELWKDANSGMTGMLSVRIFLPADH